VQGHLRNEQLQFTIQTECAHCRKPITIEIDGHLKYSVLDAGAKPMIFIPQVDFDHLEDPSIIDAF